MLATPCKLCFPLSVFVSLLSSPPFPFFLWTINSVSSLKMYFEFYCVIMERGLSLLSVQMDLKRPYLSLYYPIPPPLRECWLSYQHPNVEFWSNSLCVPNTAAGLSGDVFMTRTLFAACREIVHMWNMVCIIKTPHRPGAKYLNKATAIMRMNQKDNCQNKQSSILSLCGG